MVEKLDTLFKLDTKGKLRVWWVEIDGGKIRNVSGLEDGEKVESGWKQMKAKNSGKSNATTPEEQARVEAASLYEKQTGKGGYHYERDNADKKTYFEPQLAKTYADMLPINYSEVVYSQPKLDGHRCIGTVNGLYTRNGKRYVSVPHVELALLKYFKYNPHIVTDGELYNHELRENFNEISSCVRKTKPTQEDLEQSEKIQYHIYDIFDTTRPDLPFAERQHLIEELRGVSDHIEVVETSEVLDQEMLDHLYQRYLEDGYEGQMIRYNNMYENKRSKNLIKRKEFFDEEFKLLDIIEGEGNWAGYAKTLVIDLGDGRTSSSGLRGNQEFTRNLLLEKDKWVGGTVTVRFPNKTPDGIPRFPVAVAFYEGERDA